MSARAQENLVALALLILFAVALYMSLGYGPRARMVPVPIAILGLVLVVVQVFWQNFRSADELQIDSLELITGRRKEDPSEVTAPPAARESRSGRDGRPGWQSWLDSEFSAFALVGVLLVTFVVLSPIPAVFLFTAGYFVLSGHCSWPRGLLYGVLCTGVLYLMFGVVLGVDLNRGLAIPFINAFVRF